MSCKGYPRERANLASWLHYHDGKDAAIPAKQWITLGSRTIPAVADHEIDQNRRESSGSNITSSAPIEYPQFKSPWPSRACRRRAFTHSSRLSRADWLIQEPRQTTGLIRTSFGSIYRTSNASPDEEEPSRHLRRQPDQAEAKSVRLTTAVPRADSSHRRPLHNARDQSIPATVRRPFREQAV